MFAGGDGRANRFISGRGPVLAWIGNGHPRGEKLQEGFRRADGRSSVPPSDAETETEADAQRPANHRYYFDTGVGDWTGTFTFAITDRQAFQADSIGLVNRLLVIVMASVIGIVGRATITSHLAGFPDEAPAGVVTNEVRISLWGITLYLLLEEYVMHPDGRGVTVDSKERFGPVPKVFTRRKAHPAEVVDEGRRAIYYMPLLGTDWIGRYEVSADGDRIESVLTCDWGRGIEVIERVD